MDSAAFSLEDEVLQADYTSGARRVVYCTKCLTPNSRPRIVFDDQGACNACRNAETKPSIDWEARRQEFLRIVEPYRERASTWDCVVPWSGGKDSSSIAYRLKFE